MVKYRIHVHGDEWDLGTIEVRIRDLHYFFAGVWD